MLGSSRPSSRRSGRRKDLAFVVCPRRTNSSDSPITLRRAGKLLFPPESTAAVPLLPGGRSILLGLFETYQPGGVAFASAGVPEPGRGSATSSGANKVTCAYWSLSVRQARLAGSTLLLVRAGIIVHRSIYNTLGRPAARGGWGTNNLLGP